MTNDPDDLLRLTHSITDDLDVDWESARETHPDAAPVLRQLEEIAKLARFQRDLQAPAEPAHDPVLFHWGPLRVLEKLGAGGFAEVFRAFDPTLHREVALKLRRAGPEGSARRWLEEARRLARVRHPNVLHVYGADVHDGRAGMWMELIHGVTLEHWLGRHGRLGAREAGHIGLDVCGALAAVHAAGLVHGDIKPSNIMRETGGRIVLMDFGAGSELLPGRGAAPVAFATPAVAAPEVLRGEGASVASDLYSLGALLYRLASDRDPVAGSGFTEVRKGHEGGRVTPLRDLRPDLPREYVEVVEHALEPDPAHRYATAGAMAAALARALRVENGRGAGAGVAAAAPVAPAPAAPAPERRMRAAWWLAGAVVLAVVVAAATLWLTRGARTPGPAGGRGDVASIAVLPLVNMSEDPANEYFADGLAEQLLDDLSRIPGLRVAGRTSSFRFKGRNEDLRRIGRQLNVGAVLEGSVRQSGDRLRITMQLVNTADGFHMWSETYDRELRDIFAIQDDIARRVAEKLEVSLLARPEPRSRSVAAYNECLLGNHLAQQGTPEALASAVEHYRRAIAADPGYAAAWARLASAHVRRVTFGFVPADEGWREALAAAERALALDPDLALGHAVRGLIALFKDWDWTMAEREIARARALQPGNATFAGNAALIAVPLGREREALELERRATELDPLNVRLWLNRSYSCWANGLLDEAERAARTALELEPGYPTAHAALARIHIWAGRPDSARAEAARESVEGLRLQALALLEHARGRNAESDTALARLIAGHGDGFAFQIAEVYAWRGDVDRTFEWLERAYAQRDGGLLQLRRRPFGTALAGDPRWSALIERMRLPG